jgi:serine/threonine protein kinase
MAPELLNSSFSKIAYSSLNDQSHITTKADIFSLGATLLELASGMNLP